MEKFSNSTADLKTEFATTGSLAELSRPVAQGSSEGKGSENRAEGLRHPTPPGPSHCNLARGWFEVEPFRRQAKRGKGRKVDSLAVMRVCNLVSNLPVTLLVTSPYLLLILSYLIYSLKGGLIRGKDKERGEFNDVRSKTRERTNQAAGIILEKTKNHLTISPPCGILWREAKERRFEMPRINIYFTDETWTKLKAFIEERYGKRSALSLTVEQAVKDYLEHQRLRQELARLEGK